MDILRQPERSLSGERQQVSLKRRYISTRLLGIISQKRAVSWLLLHTQSFMPMVVAGLLFTF